MEWQPSLHAKVVAPFGSGQTVRIYCGGSATVDNHQIWTARSGALKVVLQMHNCLLESRAADLSEDLVFSSWPKPMTATPWRHFLIEGIIEVKLPTPPATSGGNPRAVNRMTAAPLCSSLLGGIILEGVHWLEGPVDGSSGGAAFHVTH